MFADCSSAMNVQKPRMKSRSDGRNGTRSVPASDAVPATRWENWGGSFAAGGGKKGGEKAARSTARNLLDQGEWAGRIVALNGRPQRRSFEVHHWLAEVHPRVAQLLAAFQLLSGTRRASGAPFSYTRVNSSFGRPSAPSQIFSMSWPSAVRP